MINIYKVAVIVVAIASVITVLLKHFSCAVDIVVLLCINASRLQIVL